MANGFRNPYITEADIDPRIATVLSVQSVEPDPEGNYRTRTRNVDLDLALSDLGYDVKGYKYSGLGDEVMGALKSVLGGSGSVYPYIDPTQGLYTADDSLSSEWDLVRSMADYLIDEGEHDAYRRYGGYGVGIMPTDAESIEFESILPFVDIFDQKSIAKALTALAGKGAAEIEASDVRALDKEMFDKTKSKYYDPLVENVREDAIFDLAKALSPDTSGGFAGSSAGASRRAQARRGYNKEMRSILSEILKQRGKATEDITSRIYDWQELI
tara:strand:- start:313 stop:1125 length:813 start_codon:yes stop_codon:yes gene_type:complete